MKLRPLYMKIWQELSAEKPMTFVVGPRQSGKTTLAHMISEHTLTASISIGIYPRTERF